MIPADDFIEGFLEHALSKEDIKRYNREYYLKNRKLKGKTRTVDRSGPVFQQGKGVVRPKPKSEERILSAEKRLQRARTAASKLPPKKRSALQKKLDAVEKKLNALKKKNPFRSKTVDRSPKPGSYDGKVHRVKVKR